MGVRISGMDELQTQAMAQLRRQDIDATIMWLRHGGVGTEERIRMGVVLMRGSLAAQLRIAGVLSCGYCWDKGCQACDPAYAWTHKNEYARLMFEDL